MGIEGDRGGIVEARGTLDFVGVLSPIVGISGSFLILSLSLSMSESGRRPRLEVDRGVGKSRSIVISDLAEFGPDV